MVSEEFRIVHFIPGRIRLKMRQIKGNTPLAKCIQQALSAIGGIHEVKVSPTTGSVLISYDPGMMDSIDEVLNLAGNLGFLLEELDMENLTNQISFYIEGNGSQVSLTNEIKALSGKVNTQIANLTNKTVDLKGLIPLTLFFLGIRSLLVTEQLTFPSWYDYFWFGFSTFFMLNPTVRSKG